MAAIIGIKIANGEFYSIVDENSSGKKRLILTTVHDKQRSVQIDLYKSFTKTMADALYIGSLVVENIKSRPKGEPSIELVISPGDEGTISAEAIDLDPSAGREPQYLNVSLKSLDDDSRDVEIPDFELEEPDLPPEGLYGKAEAINQNHKQKGKIWPVIVGVVLILLALCLGFWYFLGRDSEPSLEGNFLSRIFRQVEPDTPALPEPVPVEPAPEPPSAPQPETAAAPSAPLELEIEPEPVSEPEPIPEPEPELPPVIAAPEVAPEPVEAARTRPVPPVRSYRVPATIPRAGAPYRIRWGDTLWDIAEAFYRNPWLYPRIARFNNIRNPDFIISGRTIRIPPRS